MNVLSLLMTGPCSSGTTTNRNRIGSKMTIAHRYNYRFIIIHICTVIALITPRMIGFIDARRNNHTYDYNHNSHVGSSSNNGNDINNVIRRGHSHNDYHQKNPLDSALSHGLRSVEVDVFPLEGELFVAHTRLELDEKKTIDNM